MDVLLNKLTLKSMFVLELIINYYNSEHVLQQHYQWMIKEKQMNY